MAWNCTDFILWKATESAVGIRVCKDCMEIPDTEENEDKIL
jgi:hypothetical protein